LGDEEMGTEVRDLTVEGEVTLPTQRPVWARLLRLVCLPFRLC